MHCSCSVSSVFYHYCVSLLTLHVTSVNNECQYSHKISYISYNCTFYKSYCPTYYNTIYCYVNTIVSDVCVCVCVVYICTEAYSLWSHSLIDVSLI